MGECGCIEGEHGGVCMGVSVWCEWTGEWWCLLCVCRCICCVFVCMGDMEVLNGDGGWSRL